MPKVIKNAGDKAKAELSALRNDIDRTAEKISNKMKTDDAPHDVLGSVKDGLHRIEVKVENGARGFGAGIRRGRKAIRNATGRVGDAIDGTVHERPVAAIALLAGLGFIAGRVLHGKRYKDRLDHH